MEPEEIHEFAERMKEEGHAKSAREGEPDILEAAESSSKRISLAISVLAVLVAMVTVLGHRSHTEAVLQQSRANDAWSEYQSKKVRDYVVQGFSDMLTLQPNSNSEGVAKKLNEYRGNHTKWSADLDGLQKSAREFETEVHHSEAQAARFDLGEALLQIAVVLSSITLLTRRNTYFYLGLTLGVGGLLIAASAFLVH